MRTRDLTSLALAIAGSQPAPRTEYVTREVIEKHAPTDESVRLLKEMEEKSWAKITDAMAQEAENFFRVVTFKLEKDIATNKRHVHAVYSLNQRVFEFKIKVDEHEAGRMFWDEIAKTIADQIACKMCDDFMNVKFSTTK